MEIPEDLVIELFIKLPVKSLLRFKCVCKRWYTLIQNPNFITQHYHHDNNKTHLLVRHMKDNTVFTLFCDERLSTRQYLDHPNSPSLVTHAAGPVNGLFLLQYHSQDRCIWNPATRESRPLSELNSNFPSHIVYCDSALGFGLDPLTNEYKLIIVEFHSNKSEPVDPILFIPVVAVYDLVNDSWNRLDANIPYSLYFGNSSVCLHGHHYWLSAYMCRRAIIAFDMRNDVFREIQVPPGHVITTCLSFFSDNIALFTLTGLTCNFWVMGVEGYWTKHFSFENLPELCPRLQLWKDNMLLFQGSSSDVVLYDISTGATRNLGVREFVLGGIFQYKESLVSVDLGSKKSENRGLETSFPEIRRSKICLDLIFIVSMLVFLFYFLYTFG